MLVIPSIFSNGMVLQRQKQICFWGSVAHKTNTALSISLCLQKNANEKIFAHVAVKADGSWQCALPPQKEGGPYTISISLLDEQKKSIATKVFDNVMIGEVWLAGGQSNMEYELCNDIDGKAVLENPEKLPIRYYAVPRIPYVGKELEEAEKKAFWQENASPEMKHWSAAAYFAVKKMMSELPGITFGIIGCNWGGSYAVNWMDVETSTARKDTAVYYEEYEQKVKNLSDEEAERITAEYKDYHEEWNKKIMEYQANKPDASWKELIAHAGECKWPGPMTKKHEFRPGGLYESMIKRIAPFTMRGFLYYQGESDGQKPLLYFNLLSALILLWRKIWKDDELFFMIFQITIFLAEDDTSHCSWAIVRNAQEKVFRTIRHTGLTVLTDYGDKKDIHPKSKKIPGERAGEQILHAVYNKPYSKSYSPLIRSFSTGNKEIRIRLSYAEDGLYIVKEGNAHIKTKTLLAHELIEDENPFKIWDKTGKQYSADVFIEKDPVNGCAILVLSASELMYPIGASYGWANAFNTMLYNEAGFPASPFSTDYL